MGNYREECTYRIAPFGDVGAGTYMVFEVVTGVAIGSLRRVHKGNSTEWVANNGRTQVVEPTQHSALKAL